MTSPVPPPDYTKQVPVVVCQFCGDQHIDRAWRKSYAKSQCPWCRRYTWATLKAWVPAAEVAE